MKPMFFSLAIGLTVMMLFLSGIRRPKEALWCGWIGAAILTPNWLVFPLVGALNLDLRTMTALVGWLGFILCPMAGPRNRWTLSDALMVALLGSMTVSEYRCGYLGPTTVPSFLMQWLVPYAVGRYFLRSEQDVLPVGRIMVLACIFLGTYGVCEMVTGVNPALRLTGQWFYFLEMEQGQRFGLRRAQGMCVHPILFGMSMVLILPWAVDEFRRHFREHSTGASPSSPLKALAGDAGSPSHGPLAGILASLAPLFALMAVASSLSRGPVLAAFICLLGVAYFAMPRLRIPLLITLVLGGIVALAAGELVMNELSNVVGEDDSNSISIVINGEVVRYTGTSHRFLQFKAYSDAIANSGLFGFGYELAEVRVRYPVHSLFWSIDCHYLLFFLQYGWMGLVLFCLLAASTLWRLARVGWKPDGPISHLAGSLFGGFAAVTASHLSAYFSYDYGAVWIFIAGLAVNLDILDGEIREDGELSEDAPDLLANEDETS